MTPSHEKYQEALKLRKAGHSYSQISSRLSVSKSTLSYWFSRTIWSSSIREKLDAQWGDISRERILAMNARNKQLIEERHTKIREMAQAEFSSLQNNPIFLIGLALYWGEGDKATNGRVAVINSDPKLLKKVVAFYRKSLHVPEEKLRAAMFIYQDHDEKKSKLFWSSQLEIQPEQFIKTQVLPSRSRLTSRKTAHGMCSVYFSSTELSIKIREWINILAKTRE